MANMLPTRFRLVRRTGPIDRSTAWGCALGNLALPGSGSLLAGRVSGYAQALLALAGFGLSTVFGLRFIVWGLSRWGEWEAADVDPVQRLLELWLALRWALLGLGVFALGWLWALVTSACLLRQAARNTPPPLARP
jgi:hypothetical protein